MEIPVTQWSRHAFDPRVKNDSLTNNMSKSFNQWVGELRSKPMLTMIDTIRCRLMSRTHKRYQKRSGWTNEITPAIMGKLDSVKQKSRTCHTMFIRGDEYEVMDANRRHMARRGTGSAGPSQELMTQASVNQGNGIGSSNEGGSVLGRGMGTEGRGSVCDGGIGRGRDKGRGRAADDVIRRGRGREGASGAGGIALGSDRGKESGNAIRMVRRSGNRRDIYCLDADGALFAATLLLAVAAFCHFIKIKISLVVQFLPIHQLSRKDSTGIPHILEHSVLCGSRKYPLKEPFVELLKGSLNTFLNAFTYPDRTCYPVASTNTKPNQTLPSSKPSKAADRYSFSLYPINLAIEISKMKGFWVPLWIEKLSSNCDTAAVVSGFRRLLLLRFLAHKLVFGFIFNLQSFIRRH
ncbi:hypothetical protein L1049_001851 [Liquidambar formosana]|uniref:Peptidase M16 N-terminal domain-containing protein n=1 Tax=Liquidambar formosana TaxID=63359 RepID=A0AAP0NG40_LIQFO